MKRSIAAMMVLMMAMAGCSGEPEVGPGELYAKTLDGKTFTQADIAEKDLTIINFWGTYCMPCLAEMPDLAAYEKELPDNVQLITICVDAQGNEKSAKKILESAGYEGITLVSGNEKFEEMCDYAMVIPLTIFVDSEGNQAWDEIVGAQEDLKKTYDEMVAKLLEEGESEDE